MDEMEEVFGAVASYFSVLSEPMRLRILHAICKQEKSVSQIVKDVGATQTNISRHLGIMHRAGVVSRRKDGNLVYYRISSPAMTDICRAVCVEIISRIDGNRPLKKGLMWLVPPAGRKAG